MTVYTNNHIFNCRDEIILALYVRAEKGCLGVRDECHRSKSGRVVVVTGGEGSKKKNKSGPALHLLKVVNNFGLIFQTVFFFF